MVIKQALGANGQSVSNGASGSSGGGAGSGGSGTGTNSTTSPGGRGGTNNGGSDGGSDIPGQTCFQSKLSITDRELFARDGSTGLYLEVRRTVYV